MMPSSNYDTRPTPPPPFGSEHTDRPRYVRPWLAFLTWFFGVAATFGTASWIWAAYDRWSGSPTLPTETFIAMGVATLVFWGITAVLVWLSRRH